MRIGFKGRTVLGRVVVPWQAIQATRLDGLQEGAANPWRYDALAIGPKGAGCFLVGTGRAEVHFLG